MCVVSMVIDHYDDSWRRRFAPHLTWQPMEPVPLIPSRSEIDEFRRLLERARKYDKDNSEPDCEMAEKKQKLKALAEQLGVDISFVDEAPDA